MKVTCHFDRSSRSFIVEAEDELEKIFLSEMAERSASGSTIAMTKVSRDKPGDTNFDVEIKVGDRGK